MPAQAESRIGLIAGGGAIPIEIARSIEARGGSVHVIAIAGDADPALFAFPHTVVAWSELGRAIAALKAADVSDVLLVGTMARPKLSTARFDLALFSILPSVLKVLRQAGDDALLRTCIELFERRGFRAVGVRDVAPELLIAAGPIGSRAPTVADEADIALGLRVIAALGRFDIGQAAIVSEGVVEALEGAEGTDAMLTRTAAARARLDVPSDRRRGVLVKRPKPGQDLRVDLPAIGPGTATAAAMAGLTGIAAMHGYVLTAKRDEMIDKADAAGVFIAGVEAPLAYGASGDGAVAPQEFSEIGAVTLSTATRNDAALGVRVLRALADLNTGSALIVRKSRVVAVGASEPAADVLRRDAAYRKPGRNSRKGAAVIGSGANVDADLIAAAAAAGVAALIITPEHKAAIVRRSQLLATANSLRLALAVASREATR
ncbi:MAG: LpxI family protein [Hyphomicrobium sp.]